jgi:hypothetical protein
VKPIIRACSAGALALSLAALSPAGAAFASTEVVSGSGLLAAPAGLTPDDAGAAYPHQVRKTVTLDWTPVAGATGYRVQVGRDSTWSDDPVLTKDVLISELTLPESLPYATYVWRVAAMKGTTLGHWSSETGQSHANAEFTRGWNVVPALNAVTPSYVGDPTFSWSPVPGADAYELQVDTRPFLVSTVTGQTPDGTPSSTTQAQVPDPGQVAECFTPHTRVTPAGDEVAKSGTAGECGWVLPTDGSTLYWRVRALAGFTGEGASGSTLPASTVGLSYTSPDDKQYLDKVCGENPNNFNCDPSRPSILGLWSAQSSFVASPAAPGGAVSTTVTTDSLANDPNGLCTVVTDGSPTEAEHAVCRDVPTIRWSEVAGATNYRVTFALDAAMSNVQHAIFTPALEMTVPGNWADASALTSYYYTVQACAATCGPTTATPASFSKVTPRLTVGSAPPVTGEFRFTWNSYAAALAAATGQAATSDAFAYHVQVASADHPSYDQLVDEQLVDQTFYAPQKAYADGEYVWRVQPVDGAGNKLPWSTSQSFTRDATPPKAVSVAPSSNVGVTQAVKVTFSEPVTGVTASSLGLSPAVSHTVSVTSPTTATITPTAAMVPGATYRVVLGSAIKDLSNNVADPLGPTFKVKPQVDDSSKAFVYSSGWKVLSSSSATGGSYHGATPTSTFHPTATTKFAGIGVNIDSCMGPANGYLDVYVDNVRKARVSLYRSFSGCGVRVATITGLARATHTLKLVGVGSHPSGSKGNGVAVDYVTVYV